MQRPDADRPFDPTHRDTAHRGAAVAKVRAPLAEPVDRVPEKDQRASDMFVIARELISSRRSVSPKRLVVPGPDAEQLEALLSLAAAAPDHGLLMPWRFLIVPARQRPALAEAFALALLDRDPAATPEQMESAREKAYRAPLVMVAIACLGKREPDTPALERMISMGAAIQNILLGAHAMGFGAGLTSGRAMASPRMARLCSLTEGEVAVCCVNIGTVSRRQGPPRTRPAPGEMATVLGSAP